MKLGDRTEYDFSKLDFSVLKREKMFPKDEKVMRRVMSETLSHDDIIRTLSDASVKCHVDSYFRPVSQKEAAIRVARSGAEYCCIPEPAGRTSTLGLRVVRMVSVVGTLMGFLEDSLRGMGVDAAIEARADLNRFNTLSALYPDGRIGLFFDVGCLTARGGTDEETARFLMGGISDLSVVAMIMSMFHMARHAIQLDMFRKGCPDKIYEGMKDRFLSGCDDPAYYMASYPENLMCLEAETDAVLGTMTVLNMIAPKANAEALLLDYLNYKLMGYNTENLIFPARDGTLPTWEYALVGLTSKMFKCAEWYRTEPDHDRTVSDEYRRMAGWGTPGGTSGD